MHGTRPPCFDARLGRDGPHFPAEAEQTVLASAEKAGLWMLSSCRNGTCRACMQQLDQGQVSYRIEWPGLLAEEKAAGWFLPCVAYPEADLVIRSSGPAQSLPVV